MNQNQSQPSQLESLLVEDGPQALDTLLQETLSPFASFTRTGHMVTKPEFLKLSHTNRLLVCLLGRHAMVRLSLPNATLELGAEQLEKECAVPLKSCREYLSRLKTHRLLDKNSNGYFVPTWAAQSVSENIKKGA